MILYYKNYIDKELVMEAVKISPKFQVVIPKKIRESMQLKPGQQMQVIEYGNRVELIPTRSVKSMRGFMKGINTEFKREDDRL
jgi:AbrB family looped-hinge helix DNA binding protein